ncbi:hypothetical protein BKKJ1_0762 [Bifidobacterium catenulatum subsp. kashiwanohense]|uniref:hypothetical protein n=1 Tax=Bifidobacterium catenulatum TaxID=1686 RepID=UPI0012AFCEB8|nr:hypothetical protein [Bifidobacterium catenulatum]QGM62282.1 hypothetical protein BKKJ1_0762 [Bifidobacterium catenulatum subsp. kashiwanohense]
MTIELVDGKAGVAHISSEDKAIIHQAKFSKSDVVFDWGDVFKCSMSSSNRATIGTGCASIQGLDWHITSAESVTISNGSQGMKRNDIICAHYHRDSKTGNENVALTVLKGSPNATAAADPTIPSGKILSGAVDAYMPLWRIPLDGITVGTPVRLFTPRGALWDSVTPIHFTKLTTDPEFTISGCIVNGLATVYCRWVNKGPFGNKAWNGVALASMDVRSTSEAFNMFVDNSPEERMQNHFLYVAGNTVSFRTSYDATIPANTWHVGSVSFPVTTV